MKISEARPLSLSGIPFLMVVLAVCLILILPRYSEYWQVSILGWPLIFASWGTSVEVQNDEVILRYAFGKLPVRIKRDEIEEVKILSRLDRATVLRHFPWMGLLLISIIACGLIDFLRLPPEMLEKFGLWDAGLVAGALSYLILLAFPFGKKWHVAIPLAALMIVVIPLILGGKALLVEGAFMVFLWMVVLLTFFIGYYSQEYVLLKSSKGKYLIAIEGKLRENRSILAMFGGTDHEA